MRPTLALSLLALAPLLACAPRVVRLENRILQLETARLEAELAEARMNALPADYSRVVTLALVRDYATRAGFVELDESQPGVILIPVEGQNARFRLMIQLFDKEKVLYLAATDYFRLEAAPDANAMVSLLTQMATINYDLLLGKMQLNPKTGAINLSVELNLDDGLGYETFRVVSRHLVRTADERYPDLERAASGSGI